MPDLRSAITDQDHIQGDPEAPLTLLEYGDFQCPHCLNAHKIVKRLTIHFGPTLRFVYRNFPLIEIHPMAEPAAEAAEFAAAVDRAKYWPMHDAIFAHQSRLSLKLLAAEAGNLGLDSSEAIVAIEEQRFTKRIQHDFETGEEAGVHGTPTFFINGKRYEGSWEYEELMQALEDA
jgi:protein-disulfide isomerase